ncbi:MAG: site-specific integrase [Candidatus Acidiferrales bacterium]
MRVTEDGKRRWKGFSDFTAAQSEQKRFKANLILADEDLPTLPESKPEAGSIADAVAEFIKYSESREADWRNGADNGLSANSVVAYRKAMQDFSAACTLMGAKLMSEFSDETRGEAILLNFKKWLQQNVVRKGHGTKGAYSDSRKFTVVGQFLARNGVKMKTDRTFNPNDAGLLDHKDAPKVKKVKVSDVVFYTPEDIEAMLDAADGVHEKSNFLADDLRDLVMILLLTGMRDEEVQHLEWSDIIWANGDGKMKITIQDKVQKYDWRVKDHEKRMVKPDKNAILKARLQARLHGKGNRAKRSESGLVFPNRLGGPDQNFADRINALQKRAEAAGHVFSRPEARTHILHNFRKSWATYAMLQGEPVRNIQADLGHSELATTERYLARVDDPQKTLKSYEAIKA